MGEIFLSLNKKEKKKKKKKLNHSIFNNNNDTEEEEDKKLKSNDNASSVRIQEFLTMDTTSNEINDVHKEMREMSEAIINDKHVKTGWNNVLNEDAMIYDYDGIYDTIKEDRNETVNKNKIEDDKSNNNNSTSIEKLKKELKPQYMGLMKQAAERRKKKRDLAMEKKIIRDQKKQAEIEEGLEEPTERFITSAYKKKLAEDKLWQEQEKKKLSDEKRREEEISSKGILGMGAFYHNLHKNVSLGNKALDFINNEIDNNNSDNDIINENNVHTAQVEVEQNNNSKLGDPIVSRSNDNTEYIIKKEEHKKIKKKKKKKRKTAEERNEMVEAARARYFQRKNLTIS